MEFLFIPKQDEINPGERPNTTTCGSLSLPMITSPTF